jgi:hypothetical protein
VVVENRKKEGGSARNNVVRPLRQVAGSSDRPLMATVLHKHRGNVLENKYLVEYLKGTILSHTRYGDVFKLGSEAITVGRSLVWITDADGRFKATVVAADLTSKSMVLTYDLHHPDVHLVFFGCGWTEFLNDDCKGEIIPNEHVSMSYTLVQGA